MLKQIKKRLNLHLCCFGSHRRAHTHCKHTHTNKCTWLIHTPTRAFVNRQHNRNGLFHGFPSFVESRLFPSGHTDVESRRWKTGAQLKLKHLARVKKNTSHPKSTPLQNQTNEKALLLWSSGDPKALETNKPNFFLFILSFSCLWLVSSNELGAWVAQITCLTLQLALMTYYILNTQIMWG